MTISTQLSLQAENQDTILFQLTMLQVNTLIKAHMLHLAKISIEYHSFDSN
jgi:hypothetical protein